MHSRLDAITDWLERARGTGYRPSPLAGALKIGPHQLRVFFIERTGLSTERWLTKLRLHDALRLLRPEKSLKEVALEMGYLHQTHFSRAFKKEFGVMPTAYLRRLIRTKVRKWSTKSLFGHSISSRRKPRRVKRKA